VDRTRIAKAPVCVSPSLEPHARMDTASHQMALSALAIPVAARVRTPALAQARNLVDPQVGLVLAAFKVRLRVPARTAATQTQTLRQERAVLFRQWDSTGQSVVVFLAQSSSLDISVDNMLLVLYNILEPGT
jgi:hypothetical protein